MAGCWLACSKIAGIRGCITISCGPRKIHSHHTTGVGNMSDNFTPQMVIPTVIEQSTRGDRAYDLFSRLLRERIVLVNGPIEDNLANLVVAELLFLASESSDREINIHINSPGGVITAGLAIYDTMRSLRCPIATTCVGF